MRFKRLSVACAGMALLASVCAVQAGPVLAASAVSQEYKQGYKAGDFLLLDLQKAVLSPKLLGPPAQFVAYPVEARADAKNEIDAAADKPAVQKAVPVAKPKRQVATRPQPPTRSRVARSRSNPLDANAADTRVQVWPCRSGGICSWQK